MNLEDFRTEIIEESKVSAAMTGDGTAAAFGTTVSGYLMDSEILPDYVPAFYVGETKRRGRMRIDGYAFDEIDGTLNLIVISFNGAPDAQTLTRTQAAAIFEWPVRFVHEAIENGLAHNIEISTSASDLCDLITKSGADVRKFRFLLLTDNIMSDRLTHLEPKPIEGIPAEFQVWDVSRIYKVCFQTGRESVEVDFTEHTEFGLPCLEATDGIDAPYRCFLSVMPAPLLADIYDQWGGQLLEGNVRSFLSTKVAVNRKIRDTILNSPQMFFAFNNGISATATKIRVVDRPEGKYIVHAENFQIINGGQTTASLANARHRDKANLEGITVQMKVTEIKDASEAPGMVQKIARSSNSQNRVSDADFFSTHPFHIRMEQISRRMFAPAVGGLQYNTRWFYERARGQFLQAQMRMTPGERKKFLAQNPKRQVITKTDIAKIHNTWRGKPHIVSKGAQTNFVDFANWIEREWSASNEQFNEQFFVESVALFILFKHTEKLVSQQPWYQHGYRANIVTYSLALLERLIKDQFPGKTLDLRSIWNLQDVPREISDALVIVTRRVADSITDPARETINVTQWCKREECWARVKEINVKLPANIDSVLQTTADARAEKRQARRDQKEISGIKAQAKVVERGREYWTSLFTFVVQNRLATPEEQNALRVACRIPEKLPTPYQSQRLLDLINRAESEGFKG